MDKDFSDLERAKADGKLDEFNAELSDTASGRIGRFLPEDHDSKSESRERRKAKIKNELSRLEALLASDLEYAAAYSEARETIDDFKERMNERLELLETRIEALDEKLESHAVGSPEYKRLMRERDALQRKQQDFLVYYNDTIKPFEDRMKDPDNPPSKAELDDFEDKVRGDLENRFSDEPDLRKAELPENRATASAPLPPIG